MYYFSAIATGQGSGNPACAGRNCRSVQLCNCPMNLLAVETVRKHKVAGVAVLSFSRSCRQITVGKSTTAVDGAVWRMWVAAFGGVSPGVADDGDRSTFGCAAVVAAVKGAIAKCEFLGSELPSHWRLGALPFLQTSNPGKGQCLSSALLRKVMFARTESALRIGLPTVVLGVAGLSFMMNRTYLRC